MTRLLCAALVLVLSGVAARADEPAGEAWLRKILGTVPEGAAVSAGRRVAQDSHQLYDCRLPPVWYAKVQAAEKEAGYLMWEADAPGRLAEFALEPAWVVPGSRIVPGVPNLQQFPVPGKEHAQVASGCVPTAAANVVAYWARHGFGRWQGAGDDPRTVATRLRALLPMVELPDEGGYTDDGLCLSGAMPAELAEALRADATAHEVTARVSLAKFSGEILEREIAAKRPVLLSCEVRLPHKPALSWGHEVTGVGWVKIDGELFVGVRDNFYPGTAPEMVRWLRSDYFEEAITVVPEP